MKKLLITGGSGFLGSNLCEEAKLTSEVYATYCNHATDIAGINAIKIDLRDEQAIRLLLREIKPDGIIHTAAQASPNFCQEYPQESYTINVTATMNLVSVAADLAIPFVFTSTDLVFNGLNPPYQEFDPVSPICYYGEQKVIAEQKIREIYPQAAICRMPLMFGVAPNYTNNFLQGFINTLCQGKDLNLFTDEIRTSVSGKTAAKGLLLALEKVQGIIHLGGKERLSRYQFGLMMAEIFGFSGEQIKPCLQKDVPMAAPRSPDTSLDSSLAFSLGYQPPSLRQELLMIKKQV